MMTTDATISYRRLGNAAFALSAAVFASSIVGAVGIAILSRIRGEGWDWVFLIPIAFSLVGILLPLVAGIRIVRGGGLAWLTVAVCYLGLQVPGAVVSPLYFVVYRRLPLNLPAALLFLFIYVFVGAWVYAVRLTVLAYRNGGGGLH